MDSPEKDMQCCVTQCDKPIDMHYWNAQWEAQQIGWDIGYASPAITTYMSQYPNKSAAILIPGCGNAYEATYLVESGFTNITLIDIAPQAVKLIEEKFVNVNAVKVLCADFFDHVGNYDVIIEQTFFCAIPPNKRTEYAAKTASLLNENGKLIGLLFDRVFDKQGPPFGGCPCEYKPIFQPHFIIKTMAPCYNSIPPRSNTEVFINLVKSNN